MQKALQARLIILLMFLFAKNVAYCYDVMIFESLQLMQSCLEIPSEKRDISIF